MASNTLPQKVLGLVASRREKNHGPSRLVDGVRHLLRQTLHPIHRAMVSSRIVSVRNNAKRLRSLYANGELASRLFQLAYNGKKNARARLTEMSALVIRYLGHFIGLFSSCADHLPNMMLSQRLRALVEPGQA